MPNRLVPSILLSLAAACAVAQPPVAAAAPPDRVVVSAAPIGARDARTLGELFRARALFEELRALSPQGELAFRVLARMDAGQSDRLGLQLLTAEGRVDVELDGLSRFRLAPSWLALPAETVVRSRLRDGSVTWRSDVRTPGLPANVRRLGDLRLQCKLDWGVPLGRGGLGLGGSDCEGAHSGAMNSQFADQPVLAIDLVHGPRRERLGYFHLHGAGDNGPTRLLSGLTDWAHQLKDHMYRLPLHDKTWPDDTWVAFTFMDPVVRRGDEERP